MLVEDAQRNTFLLRALAHKDKKTLKMGGIKVGKKLDLNLSPWSKVAASYSKTLLYGLDCFELELFWAELKVED